MNGGTITENRFTNQYSGAVALNNGTMNMTDGCITANTAAADNASAGVLVKEGSVFKPWTAARSPTVPAPAARAFWWACRAASDNESTAAGV